MAFLETFLWVNNILKIHIDSGEETFDGIRVTEFGKYARVKGQGLNSRVTGNASIRSMDNLNRKIELKHVDKTARR